MGEWRGDVQFPGGHLYINSTGIDGMAGNVPALDAAITSAASFEQGPQAPGSLVSAFPLFFSVLSTSTVTPLDYLAGYARRRISRSEDLRGRRCQRNFRTSPAQLNFLMPRGLRRARVRSPLLRTAIHYFAYQHSAGVSEFVHGERERPGSGIGVAGAQWSSYRRVPATPIALNGDQVYLTLYGSGLGTATSAAATIGGVPAR